MSPDDIFAELRAIENPVVREQACRLAIAVAREVRGEALRELHGKLGSWEKVGDAVGMKRQDAWRMAKR